MIQFTMTGVTAAVDVSVVMGVYNGSAEISATLDSLFAQEGVAFEIVVVDDGSTDDTSGVLARYSDSRIRVIRQENQGLTRALVRGCAEANGKYIARQDAGDLSKPERLVEESSLLDASDDVVLVSCWTEFVGPCDEHLFYAKGNGLADRPLSILDPSRPHGLIDGPTSHPSVMFRRDAYRRTGGYRGAFYYAQDWDLWYRLGAIGKFQMVPKTLYVTRVTPTAISSSARNAQLALAELSERAMRWRLRGEADDAVVELAAKIGPSRGRVTRVGRARSLYFIGEALRRNHDPRARRYLVEALGTWPLLPKAWARLAQSFLTT